MKGRAMDERDRSGSGAGSGPPWWAQVPAPPAGLLATQLETVLDDVRTRREQVAALREQLGAFDQQLAALDQGLRPLLEWTAAWAELERAASGVWRPRPPETP